MLPSSLPGVALRVGEVAVNGGAVVPRIALLDGEAVGEEGVAARGIDQEARLPGAFAAVIVHAVHFDAAAGEKLHRPGPACLLHVHALAPRIAHEDVVELAALHLVGMGHGLVPGFGEVEHLGLVVMRRDELRRPLLHADGTDLVGDAETLEQRQIGRQQRFADVKARVLRLLQQHHPVALLGQQRCHGGARGTAADHQHVAICCSIRLPGVIHLPFLVRVLEAVANRAPSVAGDSSGGGRSDDPDGAVPESGRAREKVGRIIAPRSPSP